MHRERSKSMNRFPFRWTRGSSGVTKLLIVSNTFMLRVAGTWTGALETYLKCTNRMFWKATRRTCRRSSDQTSNRNSVMNFYRLVQGLFKDFLLWFGDTIAAVCLCAGVTAWKDQRFTLTSLKIFSRTEMNWLESNFITRWRMKPLSSSEQKDTSA